MIAALFDMDGTLVDREPLAAQAVVDVCATAGWDVGEDSVAHLHGRAWQDVHRELDVAARTGWTATEFVERVVQRAQRLAEDGFPSRVLEGAIELVSRLSDLGVPLAVVTGSTRLEVVTTLEPLGLLERFGVVVSSEDYRHGKPAPDAYLLALRELDHDADEAIAFEDSEAGVRAARAAGLQVVGTVAANPPRGHPAHQDLSDAHLVVPHLAHPTLDEWLESVLSE